MSCEKVKLNQINFITYILLKNSMERLIISINIFCLLLQYVNSQYNPQVYGGVQQAYQYPYQNIAYQQYTNRKTYKNYEKNKWVQENYEDYNDYLEEICACDKCDETLTKPACRDVCPNCFTTPPPVIAPSYVFLPFPYPYPISPNTTLTPVKETTTSSVVNTVKTTITRTEASTTETQTKATEKSRTSEAVTLSDALLEENNDVFKDKSPFNIKDKGEYTLTSLRRTKPNWLPKYGIVPISDKFAEKLMLQLRSMRVLHPQKDNMRNIDEISPSY